MNMYIIIIKNKICENPGSLALPLDAGGIHASCSITSLASKIWET